MTSRRAKTLEAQIRFAIQSFGPGPQDEETQIAELESQLQQLKAAIQAMSQTENDEVENHKEAYYQLDVAFSKIKDEKAMRDRLTSPANSKENGSDVKIDMLLEENRSISASQQLANSFIARVDATRDELANTNEALGRVGNKVSRSNANFSATGSLMTGIGRQKAKQTVILGLIIGLCTFFLIWWWLRS